MNALPLPATRRRTPARAGLLGLSALWLAGCNLMGPTTRMPADAIRIDRPAQYQLWWDRTEACAGRQGQVEEIAWFIVPGVSVFMDAGAQRVARWSRVGSESSIVIAGNHAADELVVRHEMLHALLDRGDHPPGAFIDRCQLTWESWDG